MFYSRTITHLFQRVDPGYFFVPGILGIPVGGLYGGLTSLTSNIQSHEKKIVMGTLDCMVSMTTGAVVGCVMGTIWPVSFISYALISAYPVGKKQKEVAYSPCKGDAN